MILRQSTFLLPCLVVLCTISQVGHGEELTFHTKQKPKSKFYLPQPKGSNAETIKLPPSFAPTMKLKGTEVIRFAPGMFDPKSDSFFSYVILFWVPDSEKVTKKILERELLTYYKGLAKAVLGKRGKDVDFDKFRVSLKLAKREKPLKRDGQIVKEYGGKIVWVEPFKTQKKQVLNLDAQAWHCKGAKHKIVLILVSPKARNAKIWRAMEKIRSGFRCMKNAK